MQILHRHRRLATIGTLLPVRASETASAAHDLDVGLLSLAHSMNSVNANNISLHKSYGTLASEDPLDPLGPRI